ncbi:methylated-DNA--[protein]-cysteine S-methyltransferase [Schleiferilactobacillus harbinensis]|uniref:methylated-DNA--[protein]-cysteine S-methyltransferase n=1 Tax=Schleiferilactobacillus harbinensis TaxID=304207 RepID=UPI000B13BF6D|nr:methylated-DNA--[protein]-cysteine S-methyltransferase [Schleiferilactobacillus harbinensis]
MTEYLTTAVHSPWGEFTVITAPQGLVFVGSPGRVGLNEWQQFAPQWRTAAAAPMPSDQAVALQMAFTAYFTGAQHTVQWPLAPFSTGTPQQQQVWQALAAVPYGTTISYTALAARCGLAHAVRAVASAVGKNPLLIVLPCHRIVRQDGSVGQYRAGTAMKQQLITFEHDQLTV